jgi:CubicO group peptidase (beta-lactamase class C family)
MLDITARSLDHRLATSQVVGRLPSVVGGLVRDGALAWQAGFGAVDDAPPTADTQYRIGSITKTFTAVLVLRLRDEGRLDLSDPLDRHVPGAPHGDRTIADLLAHTGGVQAETDGAWWERTPGGDRTMLYNETSAARLPAGRHYHYSNVGYGLLGALVEEHRRTSWAEALTDEILHPLGLTRTTMRPAPPHAAGWAVHPWADVLLPEPEHDAGAMAPAGQLWSTVADLAVWGAFLAGDTGDVLSADTLDEMAEPLIVHDDAWSVAHGLGVQVFRRGDRRLIGHGGSMPGFLAHLVVSRDDHAASLVMANATTGLDDVAFDLLDLTLDREPRQPEPWAPAIDVDPDVLDLVGPWHWGPVPFALRLEGDRLHLAPLGPRGRAARFRRNDDGTWTGLNGYYRGERLTAGRDGAGRVTHLDIATFVFTRAPYDPAAPVPGGVDPDGWR